MTPKPGHKMTEVGEIPVEWEVKTLGMLGPVSAGGTPSRAKPAFWDGDIPWITTSEIDFDTITCSAQTITDEGLANSAARLLPPGTLLLALYGQGKTRGKSAILGIEAATNQACAAISIPRQHSLYFVFYYLASHYEAIRNLSNTGNQENLNTSIVRSLPLPLPPLPEQRAIAEALSDVDALLASLDTLIAKKRDLKQAAMQQLLTGKTRLPGFEGKGYKQTDVGLIPEDWEVQSIGKTLTLINGRAFKPEDWKKHGTPIIRIQNLNDPSIGFNCCDVTIEERHLVRSGDVLFAWSGTTGTSFGARVWNGPTGVLNQHIFKVISASSQLTSSYAFLILQKVQDEIEKQSHGFKASFVHVKKSDLVTINLPLPPLPEQQAIAQVLSDMDAEITALEQRRDKTRALKQGMMQELLTGRIRLV